MSLSRVPVLYLAAPRGGWAAYARYEGDDVYVVHAGRGGRRASMRFLSRDAAAEYLQSLLPSRDVEMALISARERDLDQESFSCYHEAVDANSAQELIGADDADGDFDSIRRYLLLLRDGRCLPS